MSVFVVGSKEWCDYIGDTDAVCFLCGNMLKKSEEVVHWMGSGGPKVQGLPFVPKEPESLMVLDALAKHSGGLAPALNIFFHLNCVPSFCRRILQDWERVVFKD